MAASLGGYPHLFGVLALIAGLAALATFGTKPRSIVERPPTILIATLGLVMAGAGTAVLFPAVLGIMSRNVEESYRGRATSVVTTISYLGFLLGPVYVGLWANATGLRGAMTAVATLAAALFLLTSPLRGLSRSTGQETRHSHTRDIKTR